MRALALIFGLILNIMLLTGARELGGFDGLQTFALLGTLNFVAILFHELGHAWAFRHVGGSVSKIVVLFVSYDPRRRRLGWYRGRSSGDVGGFVAGRYRPEGPTVRDRIIVAAAGPVANIATGGLAIAFAALWGAPLRPGYADRAVADDIIVGNPVPDRPPVGLPSQAEFVETLDGVDVAVQAFAQHQFGYTALILFGTLSIGIALLNLIPFGGSDGQAIGRALQFSKRIKGRRS